MSDRQGYRQVGIPAICRKPAAAISLAVNINQWPVHNPGESPSRRSGESRNPVKHRVASSDTSFDKIPGQARHDDPAGQARHDERNDPVFIIGFPRSGSTLLDTLLRGHPDIRVAEESDAVSAMVNRLSGQSDERLETLADLPDQDMCRISGRTLFQCAGSPRKTR